MLWDALAEGSAITNIEAFQRWNCTRLGGLIFNLRTRHNAPIKTRTRNMEDGTQYAVYVIDLDENDPNYLAEVNRVAESIKSYK